MSRSKTLPSGEPRPRYDAERLLDVAARVFTERGYDGTSMEDLSRASGLSKSSLYHHVASKEQLLRRALERAVDPLFAIVDEPGASDGRAVDRLEYVIDRAVHVLAERLPYVTLLLHRSEEHTSELQSRGHLVCRLLLEKKKKNTEQKRQTTEKA